MNTENMPEAAVVARLAGQAVLPEQLEPGCIYAVADLAGNYRIMDTDQWADRPSNKLTSRTVRDPRSFLSYMSRHAGPDAEVWADPAKSTVVGVIDSRTPQDGAASLPAHERHTVNLVLKPSPEWRAWAEVDDEMLSQASFADFLEQHSGELVSPAPAELVSVARHLEAAKSVEFVSGVRAQDGQLTLSYRETIKAKAGQAGELTIPERIELALRPFLAGPAYRVHARFRYRIDAEQQLRLGIVLDQPDRVLESAFDDIVTTLRDGIPGTDESPAAPGVAAPIYLGTCR